MDFENYTRSITAINDQLQDIANLTASQAITGCADPSNPHFVKAMDAHKRLTDLSAKLSGQMLSATVGEVDQVEIDEYHDDPYSGLDVDQDGELGTRNNEDDSLSPKQMDDAERRAGLRDPD